MLVNKDEVFALLRCPKTGASLNQISSDFLVSNNSKKIHYKIIEGYPILIDYEKSLFLEDQIVTLNSVVNRQTYNGIMKTIKRIVTPQNKVSIKNIINLKKLLSTANGKKRVLIIGGSTIGQGTKSLYDDPSIELIAFDIYATQNVQFVADTHNIPLPSNIFDGVVIQAVLEHVLEPKIVVSEIYRLLKDNGLIYSETPFLQHVHEGAYDFIRFTESGHRFLFQNFKTIDSGVCASAGTQLLWSIDYFFRSVFRSKKIGKIIKLLFFWLQYIDAIIPKSYGIDAASCVYFLGQKQKIPIKGKNMINYYQGMQK